MVCRNNRLGAIALLKAELKSDNPPISNLERKEWVKDLARGKKNKSQTCKLLIQ
jgi:hypothetical protein